MQLLLWGFTFKYNVSKVQRLQNRAARFITGDFDYVHVKYIDIVKNLKWMNVIQRRDYRSIVCVYMYSWNVTIVSVWLHNYV